MVAYWLFRTEQRNYIKDFQDVQRRLPTKKEIEVWHKTNLSDDKVQRFKSEALERIGSTFSKANAEILNGKVGEAIREAEKRYLGELHGHISTWSTSHQSIEARLAKLASFWRTVATNTLSGLVSTVIGLVLTGLIAFGFVFKDFVSVNQDGINVKFPAKASPAASTPGARP